MRKKLTFASVTAAAAVTAFGATGSAYGLGAQDPSPDASCMGWLADAANPNASGDHIAAIAQNGDANAVARARPTGDGFPALISCVEQIP